MSTWRWIGLILVAVIVAVLVTWYYVRRADTKKVSYVMDALEDGELNFHFRKKTPLNDALNRIKGIFERRNAINEETSWSKLFRVMTHEIMNTIAPIASLSDTLLEAEKVDVKTGLETISTASKDLIRFVESYRSFTQTVQPIRKAVMVDELMERVLRLNKAKIEEQGSNLIYYTKAKDLLVYADEGQIMLVINNLIKNAVQAGANAIRITAELNEEDQTIIRVANNGKAIPQAKQEEIFVPFYTTKPNGTGIGLSLSRQIMIKHHGILRLEQSDEKMTVFAMIFK